jgi:acyl-CoA thioesterase-1
MRIRALISILGLIFMPLFLSAERIVFLGDSLTAGYGLDPQNAYPQLVETALNKQGRNVKVINAGLSGDTSAGGLHRVDWILRQPIDVLFIALGANDALRGLPVEATRKNLQGIIVKARQKNPDIRIILAGMLAPPNMGEAYRNSFDRIYPDLAESESVELLPFILEGVAGDPALNLGDGIHPNVAGHQRIAEMVIIVIDPQ